MALAVTAVPVLTNFPPIICQTSIRKLCFSEALPATAQILYPDPGIHVDLLQRHVDGHAAAASFADASPARHLPQLVQGRCTEARMLAQILIQKGWLTVYQVNQLLAGKAHELVIGPYHVLDKLGQGGLSAVFKARHRDTNCWSRSR